MSQEKQAEIVRLYVKELRRRGYFDELRDRGLLKSEPDSPEKD
jgi:hypothetical protein